MVLTHYLSISNIYIRQSSVSVAAFFFLNSCHGTWPRQEAQNLWRLIEVFFKFSCQSWGNHTASCLESDLQFPLWWHLKANRHFGFHAVPLFSLTQRTCLPSFPFSSIPFLLHFPPFLPLPFLLHGNLSLYSSPFLLFVMRLLTHSSSFLSFSPHPEAPALSQVFYLLRIQKSSLPMRNFQSAQER